MAKFKDKTYLEGGVVLPAAATTNVNDTTPTLAELTTALPAMAANQFGTVNDANGNTNVYLVYTTDGTTRFFLKMTKAA